MKTTVLLPKNTIPQQLNRDELLGYNFFTEMFFELNNNTNKGEIIIQDGPPYANNDFHMGHLLNKTLKDVYVKHCILNGKKVKFQFGFDCHGLPIELKANGNIDECANIVNKYKESQKNTANKFGIFSYGQDYLTMDESFKEGELKLFNQLLESGDIYKAKKIVWYSPSLNTVLANSQLNYKEVEGEGLYVIFDNFLVYTTTEWTLSANQALCLNPNIQYVKTDDGLYCSESYANSQNFSFIKVDIKDLPTEYGLGKPILFDNFVTDNVGTGIVHLCGGHGLIDNEVLVKNNIEPKTVSEIEDFAVHLNTYKFNGLLYSREKIIHSYPFDDRTDQPVYQFLTEQYFVNINKAKVYDQIKQIKMTNRNKETLLKYVNDRPEWCISRQRKWGVSIPNSSDILDVWFDSGCVFLLNDKPADLYIEGVDQFRGWFQSSVILSSLVDRQCTKRIFSHGFILDEYKEKLSKSKGNFTALDELYDKYNPDVLRLWICLSDFKNDVTFSEESLHNATKQYFKIRNWLRYFVNNLYNDDVQINGLKSVVAMVELKRKVNEAYENLEYRKAFDLIFQYLQKYSSALTEEIKNKLYESDLDSDFRKEMEADFRYNCSECCKLLYPMLPFLCSEITEKL